MHSRARAIGLLLTSATLLAGSVLAAAPASAAPPSLTATSCQAQGGTFTRSQGVKTCVLQPVSRVVTTPVSKQAWAPFDPSLVTFAGLTADGYEADWNVVDAYSDTTTLTQKGAGTITRNTVSTLVQEQPVTDQQCFSLTTTSVGTGYGFAYVVQCDVLGLFPAGY